MDACLTPTFGTVYAMALQQGTAVRGAFLSACYCVGLGVPFVLTALGTSWLTGALALVRRHRRTVSMVSGAVLIAVGALMISGQWGHWMDGLRSSVGPGGVDI